jgi:hypothetical protein
MPEIEKALKDASAPNFWGSVEITYREGRAFIVKVTRTTQLIDYQKVKTYDRSEAR